MVAGRFFVGKTSELPIHHRHPQIHATLIMITTTIIITNIIIITIVVVVTIITANIIWFRYVQLPLTILTVFTVPDCRKPGKEHL